MHHKLASTGTKLTSKINEASNDIFNDESSPKKEEKNITIVIIDPSLETGWKSAITSSRKERSTVSEISIEISIVKRGRVTKLVRGAWYRFLHDHIRDSLKERGDIDGRHDEEKKRRRKRGVHGER